MRFSHPTHGHDERRRHRHGDDGHHRRGFGRRSGHPGSDEPDALELSHDHGSRRRPFGHRGRHGFGRDGEHGEGRAVANAQVARSLYERAIGFRHTVQRTVLHRGEERTITNTVQYPPDTQACIFWLRNRCRENWDVRPARLPHEGGQHSEAMLAALDAAGERARASREGD